MGRSLRIALYSPYLGSTYGGGEKYLLLAAQAVAERWPAHQVEVVGAVPPDAGRYERMFGVNLDGLRLRSTNRRVTRFHRALNRAGFLRPLRDRVLGAQAGSFTAGYDLFIGMSYVIPVRSRARLGVVLCQFPHRLRSAGELAGYRLVVCQSEYVRGWVRRLWDRDAMVVHPPVDVPEAEPDWAGKGNLILSVGRFIGTGHDKRQEVMVEAFRQLCDAGLAGWELHLAGAVHRDARHAGRLDEVARLARGYPVRLHPDAGYAELQNLYARASIYWHAAGFGVDESRHPEALEHFGMTTGEAMAHGAVPVVIARGGQPELVRDGVEGYLWGDLAELGRRTFELARDPALRRRLGEHARSRSRAFSRDVFRRRIQAALEPLVSELEAR